MNWYIEVSTSLTHVTVSKIRAETRRSVQSE